MPVRLMRAGPCPGTDRTTAMNSPHAQSGVPATRRLLRSLLSALLSGAALWLLIAFPASRLLDQITGAAAPVTRPAAQPATPHS